MGRAVWQPETDAKIQKKQTLRLKEQDHTDIIDIIGIIYKVIKTIVRE